MKPLYVIVHEQCVTSSRVQKELDRIKKEEEFYSLTESAGPIPPGMPSKDREIRICGAFMFCVGLQHESFVDEGYKAEIYLPATQKDQSDL
ncbi:MAG: hypothetical protein ABIB43_06775 [archaeon]